MHFGTVLALAAFLCMPGQNTISLSLGFGIVGVGGLIYAGIIVASMRRNVSRYVPVFEDWLWHAILPMLVYAALLFFAILIQHRIERSLYGVAAASVLMLFIGIHNAWDVAVSISVRKEKDSSQG